MYLHVYCIYKVLPCIYIYVQLFTLNKLLLNYIYIFSVHVPEGNWGVPLGQPLCQKKFTTFFTTFSQFFHNFFHNFFSQLFHNFFTTLFTTFSQLFSQLFPQLFHNFFTTFFTTENWGGEIGALPRRGYKGNIYGCTCASVAF